KYYTANGESTFYPLIGTTIHLTVKSVKGDDHVLAITIPPIPLNYLDLDHPNNIIYDKDHDSLSLENPGINIQSNDLLKVIVSYYTFGGNAIGTGIQLNFEMAQGKYKGTPVLYNPMISGQRINQVYNETGPAAAPVAALPPAPFVGIPMILNPECEYYESILQSPELWVYVEEKGDLQEGFRGEQLLVNPISSNAGIVYIKINHLTAVGLGVGAIPNSEVTEQAAECVDCDGASTCFLETILNW
ncbi:hypothetical protein MHK_010771, partial [Candidatus Magnetomorum sp. HK-1]